MAVTQISRIQHRRGLEQDLPQLSSAELGWSLDTRKLYIGNGTLEEGAPTVGLTRILTEHDITDITSSFNYTNYTFVGNSAGYTAQTGANLAYPVIRSFQQKLDDVINAADFGAVGDGITDDTSAINRALQQIYKSTVSSVEPRARRTILFSGGTYVISDVILIPPYAKLVGAGKGSTIIKQTRGNRPVANVCDSLFQTGANIGTSSAILPQDIEIKGIQFLNSNSNVTASLFNIDSASNVIISDTKIVSNSAAGFYPNLVSLLTTSSTTNKITFDNCQFIKGGNALSFIGTSITSVRAINCAYDDLSNVAVNLGDSRNYTSIGNYYGTVGGFVISNGNNYNVSVGDYYHNSNPLRTGLNLGNLQLSSSQQYDISTTPLVLTPTSNTASIITYEIKNGANIRLGTFSYAKTNSNISYDDSYVENNGGVNGNLTANSDSILVSLTSGTASFKFNYKTFI